MYRDRTSQIRIPDDFFLPFGGKLNKENRWVKLEALIPWWELEERYARNFRRSNKGEPALSIRVALGSLIIQAKQNLTDRETVNQIMENPYLQYFIGYERYEDRKPPFDPSLMVHFRKRIGPDLLSEVNELIALAGLAEEQKSEDDDEPKGDSGGRDDVQGNPNPPNKGVMLIDATCAPSDIRYPTDLGLLNTAREKLEDIIDVLHEPDIGRLRKPRTYRNKARKIYLSIEKQRRKNQRAVRKAIGKQLGYVKRNLSIIDSYLQEPDRMLLLTKYQKEHLQAIRELYAQQLYMYKHKLRRVDQRIVSISQPHLRPIVRGKAGTNVEFGNKILTSVVNGYSFVEKMSFSNYNEGTFLQEVVENFRRRFGHYPEAVMADTIFRNRENLQWLKQRGIRISGPALGRPPKVRNEEQKAQTRLDAGMRNGVESSYGVAKRRYGLSCIRAKLPGTTESTIMLQFLVMNLDRRLRILLTHFLFAISRCINGHRLAYLQVS